MSFDKTNLLTLIVRAHDRHPISVGKVMRVTLQAAANRKLPLYNRDGSPFKLRRVDRKWLLDHAAIAEQQHTFRWWEKKPWLALEFVLVSELKFWEWFNGKVGAPKTAAAIAIPAAAPAKTKSGSGAKSQGIEEAIKAIWSGNVPKGLSAKDRNRKITDWLTDNKLSVPTDPARAIQRVLKKLGHQATKQMS